MLYSSFFGKIFPDAGANFHTNSTAEILTILIGFVFLAVLWVLNAILVIIAAIQASEGKFYRYPITIRFIQ